MPSSNKAIKTRADSSPANYSNDVKKKLAASNRTGQACDRCRIRKMRCDDLPDGCSPCMQNQSECKTTDRITGRATVRGYVQNLERRLQNLEIRNRELEDRMMSMGIDVRATEESTDPTTASLLQWNETQGGSDRQAWGNHRSDTNSGGNGTSQYVNNDNGPSNELLPDASLFPLPDFRGGLAGNNYLGVSTGNSLLSSIRGTSLTVLGMKIDLADYMSSDLDEPEPTNFLTKPLYNKSYHAFVQTAFSAAPKLEKIQLPSREEGLLYAQWYFRVINPYLPILHKPSFLSLLTRIYDDQGEQGFQPTTAETVMVHMMFAIMFFQYAARNWEDSVEQSKWNDLSNRHYHYALGFFPQLVANHTLHDVQALTILSLHLRNFPKPGAGWMITTMTINMAIDLGLHRSARQWASSVPKKNCLELEMRKRVFWSILVIHLNISGKLGRPMALRPDDFDIEIPEALDDDLLDENRLDTSRPGRCGFLVGIEAYKIEQIYMDLYNNVYAVKRSPKTYIESVRRLDNRARQWCEGWPPELLSESVAENEERRVQAQYLNIWLLEFRLLLRHPSLSLTPSTEFNHENLTVCMEVSQKMLHHVKQIQWYKSLDTNWQNGALEDITTATFETLKDDMEAWLSIMGDVGGLLGSGNRLQEAVRVTVDNTLGLLSRHLASKTASSALSAPPAQITSPIPSLPQTLQPNQEVYHPSTWSTSMAVPKTEPSTTVDLTNQTSHFLSPEVIAATPNPYPDPSSYAYPEPTSPSYPPNPNSGPYTTSAPYPQTPTSASYPPNQTSFPQSPYPQSTQQATAAAANAYLYSNPPSFPLQAGAGGSSSWHHWAGNMASSLEPQEYLSSASALMQLGRRGEAPNPAGPGVPVTQGMVEGETGSGRQPWPLMIFDAGASGG